MDRALRRDIACVYRKFKQFARSHAHFRCALIVQPNQRRAQLLAKSLRIGVGVLNNERADAFGPASGKSETNGSAKVLYIE